MDYEIRHDEYKGDDSKNEYWHGILFLPTKKKEEIINLLKVIRKEYNITDYKDIKFAGCLKSPNTKDAQIVKNNIDLFSHLLITKDNNTVTDIYHRTGKDTYEKKCVPFLRLRDIFNCKFVIFRIPDNHKSLSNSMKYSDRVETTFRIGFKGGAHLLFSEKETINIKRFYFDGCEHHGRNIDLNKITKGDFKNYCSFSKDCDIDDRSMKDRNDESKIIMSFVDNIIGAMSAKLNREIDAGGILFSLDKIYDRLKSNKIITNKNGRWYKSISVSKLIILDKNIIFPNFFENCKQGSLF